MIEKYKSPTGDGNFTSVSIVNSFAFIEKYKSPTGDGNDYSFPHNQIQLH